MPIMLRDAFRECGKFIIWHHLSRSDTDAYQNNPSVHIFGLSPAATVVNISHFVNVTRRIQKLRRMISYTYTTHS